MVRETMANGQVEKNVQDARHRMWQVMLVFADLDELNQWLEDSKRLSPTCLITFEHNRYSVPAIFANRRI